MGRRSALAGVLIALATCSPSLPAPATRLVGTPPVDAAAPTGDVDEPRPPRTSRPDATFLPAASTTSTTTSSCRRAEGDPRRVDLLAASAVQVAISLARRTHDCAPTVVVGAASHGTVAAMLAPLAAAREAPLLLTAGGGDIGAELSRLDPSRVLAPRRVHVPPGYEVTRLPRDAASLGVEVAERLAGRVLLAPGDEAPVIAADAARRGRALLAVTTPTPPAGLAEAIRGRTVEYRGTRRPPQAWREVIVAEASRVIDRTARSLARSAAAASPQRATMFLLPRRPGSAAAPIATSAALADDGVLVAAGDLRTMQPATRVLLDDADRRRIVLHDAFAGRRWQARVVLRGAVLPAGGLLVYPDRRYVALYGKPGTAALGVLGEQGPEASADRARRVTRGYGADGRRTVPTFEIIATMASASAGEDGDYSAETAPDELLSWLRVARRERVYVVLDLQPGRTDFLTQAKRYRELLALPHVGLALDPEWRLGPDEFHLQQVGSVAASEVNATSRWLARLTRQRALPQKLFLVHQFQLRMIRHRDRLVTDRPELAFTIQMDGHGSQAQKQDTYDTITAGFERRVSWGWKNFYDEDRPMATPSKVLAKRPRVVFVSFQ